MMCAIKRETENYVIDIPDAASVLKGTTVMVHVVRDHGEFKSERATIKRTTVGAVRLSLYKFKSLIRRKNHIALVTIADPDNVMVTINPREDEIWVAAEAE